MDITLLGIVTFAGMGFICGVWIVVSRSVNKIYNGQQTIMSFLVKEYQERTLLKVQERTNPVQAQAAQAPVQTNSVKEKTPRKANPNAIAALKAANEKRRAEKVAKLATPAPDKLEPAVNGNDEELAKLLEKRGYKVTR
jgi:hypothetical protein